MEKSTPYSLRRKVSFLVLETKLQKYGANSLKFRVSFFENDLPANLKECLFLPKFRPLPI